jgi:tetratricopeptide (TPR) repeat protein
MDSGLFIAHLRFWTARSVLAACSRSLVPLLGNRFYRTAYTAYQERRWGPAAEGFRQAARWQPLHAKYQQLRGEAWINLGDYDKAIVAYESAIQLAQEFAPNYAQLGWLYWLRGDLDRAVVHFQKALELDPREAWRDGLHANLGLVYVALGKATEAIPLFKETIEAQPELALAPYWLRVQRSDGRFDVVLDPVYADGQSDGRWQARVLAHLGRADYTPRLFDYESSAESPVSFHQVLDAVEADYVAARKEESREAPSLLATVATAARYAGLHDRAQDTYLAFQEAYPQSAYGFRGLGDLYREQGRLQEAQEMLQLAVEVSPRDATSWAGLAEVALDRGLVGEAEQALDALYRLAPFTPQLYVLRSRLYQQMGDSTRAARALRQSLIIEESVPGRISLAQIYRRQENSQRAHEQCLEAADGLLRTWPRPLDPALWEIGVCLAETDDWTPSTQVGELSQTNPLIGNVLTGHVYRAQGLLDRALDSYTQAVEARPDEGASHYLLGETYQALGQIEMAENEYLQAFQLDPLESLPLLALGRLQWENGQHVAALESFRAATEATPGWGQAQIALGNALFQAGDREGAAHHYHLAQIVDRDVREGQVYDFAAHLAEAEVQSPGPKYVRNDYFTISDDQRRVLFAHPESSVRYRVRLPEDAVLAFEVATAPESWEQPGDGVSFAVYVEPDQDVQPMNPLDDSRAFFVYLDPKQDKAARRWHAYEIDLGCYGGERVNIIFETGAGPAGDERYDWAGWGEPRLLKRQTGSMPVSVILGTWSLD